MNPLPKSVLVTGANGGLGLATIRHILADGVTRIVLACRTRAKAVQAREELAAEYPDADLLAAGGFDMNDPAAIAEAVAALPPDRLYDVVFLQAGGVVFGSERQATRWGALEVERTVSQNVLGGVKVFQELKKRRLLAARTRVVVAGGEGARGIPGLIAKPEFRLAVLAGRAQGPREGGRKYADSLVGAIGVRGDVLGAPEGSALGAIVDQKPMNPALTDAALQRALGDLVREITGPLARAA